MSKFIVPISLVWVGLALVVGLVIVNKPNNEQVVEKTTTIIREVNSAKKAPASQSEELRTKVEIGAPDGELKTSVTVK